MTLPLWIKTMAAEALERRYPDFFACVTKDDMILVAQFCNLHPEVLEDCLDLREVALAFEGVIVTLVDRGKLKSCLASGFTAEALQNIDSMRQRTLKPAKVAAAEVVAAPAPAKSKAELEAEADAAMVDAYRTNHRELRDAVKRDPKQRARMERLIAAGRI